MPRHTEDERTATQAKNNQGGGAGNKKNTIASKCFIKIAVY
ncbi:MAG: hypothetical protein JWQ40_2022 [Segetibacter sp.]|nr:hypothetical protein [Segetibacter sp.]